MYSREIDGTVLTISPSGWTYDRLFVLFDYQTESLWYHLPGTNALTCITGHYEGRTLPVVNYYEGLWPEWRTLYPKTKVQKTTDGRPPLAPPGR